MLRRVLLLVDALLIVAAGMLGVHLYRVWTTAPVTAPAAPTPAPATAAPPPGPTSAPPRPPFSTFAVVAERNLFTPNRTETAPEPPKPSTTAAQPPPAPKPHLHGIVLTPDGKARAYLEDARARKVFGYSVGDSVADSRVEQIKPDRVVLRRGGEVFDVLLRDPSKPKPPPPAQAPAGAAAAQPPRGVPGGQAPTDVPGPRPPLPGQPPLPPGGSPSVQPPDAAPSPGSRLRAPRTPGAAPAPEVSRSEPQEPGTSQDEDD